MKFVLASAVAALVAGPAAAAIIVTYEAPGVQNTTLVLQQFGIEDFNTRTPAANTSFTTDFGTGGIVQGYYQNVDIRRRDQFGGAGSPGTNYAEVDGQPYAIDFTVASGQRLNYFGFWWSAVDRGNRMAFYNDGVQVFALDAATVRAALGTCPDASNGYCGKPNQPLFGLNPREQYAFVNVQFTGDHTFDRIVWREFPDVGDFESDNHTVGFGVVPEPATWAMLITGFGLVGFAARRRRVAGARALA